MTSDIEPNLEGLRLLVVEDDPDTRDLLTEVLASTGASVKAVRSSVEALDALASDKTDVLITDIGLPDEDGYALLRKLRSSETRGVSVPAIALTVFNRADDRARSLRAGFAAHVPKPIDEPELFRAIASAAGRGSPSASASSPSP